MTFSSFIQQPPAYAAPTESEKEVEYKLEMRDNGASVEDLIQQLMSLASFANKLYLQAHLIHLNAEGPLFLPLHDFFKEQYKNNIDNFDILAELIRSMNYLMPMCEKGLNNVCADFEHIRSYNVKSMVITYIQNLEKLGMFSKEVSEKASEVEAPDVENKLADLVNFCFKSSWMLKATLRG